MTTKNGKRCIGHGQWALGAVLHLGMHQVRRRARNLRAGAGLGPRRAVLAFTHCRGHQQMPCRIEDDLVDSVAEPIVRLKLRPESVGTRGERIGFGAAHHRAPGFQPLLCPRRAFALGGASQRSISQVQIAPFKRRGLIGIRAFQLRGARARQGRRVRSLLGLRLFHLRATVGFTFAMREVAFPLRGTCASPCRG